MSEGAPPDPDVPVLRLRIAELEAQVERLRNDHFFSLEASEIRAAELENALVEIDTYLANDPDVWRIVSVCKAGEVLCDVLGPETIAAINAGVEANLCAKCSDALADTEGATNE